MKLPSLHFDYGRSWQRLRAWDWQTIGLVVVVKLLLLSYATQAVASANDNFDGWLKTWQRWDAVHYVAIAQHGYSASGPDRVQLAFFPLYPALVRLLSFVTRDVLAAAFVISGFASVAAGLLLQRLVRLDEPEEIARSAVWLLFIYPTSYFLHIPYTEGLFLALVLACFLAARMDRWRLASLLGACACLTRMNGLVLAPALAIEALSQARTLRRMNWCWLWIAAVPLGFLGYLALNYSITGDFFAFATIQQEHWFHKFRPPWVGVHELWLRTLGENPLEGLHEFFFVVLSLLFTIWSWIWLRPSYAMWMTCNWLLINSTNFVLSVPRYTLTMFPIFILAARATRGRGVLFAGVTIWSLIYFAFYAGRFARGLWAY